MISTLRRTTALALLAAALMLAPAAASSQAPGATYTWSNSRFVLGANGDSGVYLAISRDTLSGSAWFVPAHVSEWGDSMAAALGPLAKPAASTVWTRFGRSIRSADGREGITILWAAPGGVASFRVAFDPGGASDAITADLAQSELQQFVASMRTSADSAGKAHATSPAKTLYEFRVTKAALVLNSNPLPRWPQALEGSVHNGSVLIQVVIDSMGKPNMSTFKVLRTSNMLFADELRRVLPLWTFSPAEANGHRVAQVVQLPFDYAAPR